MGDIPLFSIFSAISEVFVTIGVLYSVITTMRGNPMPKVLLGVVVTFEACVNVVYMAIQAGKADRASDLSAGMKLFFAAHGTLSLVMFLTLAILYLISLADLAKGRDAWFRRNPVGTWVLVAFWMLSVGTGEVIFYMRYIAA